MSNEGQCPKCKKWNLVYDGENHQDGSIYYPFKCTDCGFKGLEWYDVVFSGFTDEENQEVD